MFLSGRKSSGPRRRDRTAQRSNKARIFRVAPTRSARGRLFPRNYEQLGGLGLVQAGTIPAPAESGSGGSIIDSITSIFQTAIPAYSQYRLMKTNTELVKAGKAPLDPAMIAPVVKVQAGVSPGVTNLTRTAMIIAGVAVGGMLLLRVFKR